MRPSVSIIAVMRIAALWLAVWAVPAIAQGPHAMKAAADSAYVASDFAKAIEGYEAVLAQGFSSAEVHYNLGNAYFKSGRIAPSILHYERAQRLAPHDEDIRFNLRLAQMTTKDRIGEMPRLFFLEWRDAAMQALPMDGWAWMAVAAVGLAFLLLTWFRFSSSEALRKALFYASVVLFAIGASAGYAAHQQHGLLFHDSRAVVFRPTLNVKSAPEQAGKDLFVIHEGLVVDITESIGDWYRIRLADGNVGWVPKASVQPL